MANLLQRGASFHGERSKAAAGRSIVYTRRTSTFTATGWPEKVDYEVDVDPQTGLALAVTFYDWTFTFADLGFDATLFDALPGDQISETLNGVDYVYEVAPVGKRKILEWIDSGGVLVVVHSKLVEKSLSA